MARSFAYKLGRVIKQAALTGNTMLEASPMPQAAVSSMGRPGLGLTLGGDLAIPIGGYNPLPVILSALQELRSRKLQSKPAKPKPSKPKSPADKKKKD